LPASEPAQERVDVPEPPLIVLELRVHDRLVELVVTTSATVLAKPFNGFRVMIEVPATPTFTLRLVGLSATVKS